MARIKKDSSSWRARSILRRDARHDSEAVADLPSNGHKRKHQRRHVKNCVHDYQEIADNDWYIVTRCTKCGKRKYNWHTSRWLGRRQRPLPNPHWIRSESFPIHEQGTCNYCDMIRARNGV